MQAESPSESGEFSPAYIAVPLCSDKSDVRSMWRDCLRYSTPERSTDPSRSQAISGELSVLVIMPGIAGLQIDVESDIRQLMALAKRGHRVTCVVASTSKSLAHLRDVPGFKLETVLMRRVVPVLSPVFFQLAAFLHTFRMITRCHAIVLYVHSVPIFLPFLMISRLRGRVPVLILRIHTNPVETGGPLRTLAMTFTYALSMKLSAAFFDKIFFISPMLARLYSEQLSIPRSRARVWPSPVDMDIFELSSTSNANLLRRQLGLPDGFEVLYHGMLSASRGIMETVEAFKILSQESVSATLVLLGDGPLKEYLRRYVQESGLGETVKIVGPVDYRDVPRYIAACDVGIVPLPDHPWWRYQCPTKILECLSMNKPLILSDLPAHRWMVGDTPIVVYLKGTSPRQISNGVHEFLASRANLNPRLGRQLAAKFSMEQIAEMIEQEILSALRPERATRQ